MDAGAESVLSHFPDADPTGAGAGFAAEVGGEETVGGVGGRDPALVEVVVVAARRVDEVVVEKFRAAEDVGASDDEEAAAWPWARA